MLPERFLLNIKFLDCEVFAHENIVCTYQHECLDSNKMTENKKLTNPSIYTVFANARVIVCMMIVDK